LSFYLSLSIYDELKKSKLFLFVTLTAETYNRIDVTFMGYIKIMQYFSPFILLVFNLQRKQR
jgi:hypothetical protein